MIDRRSRTSVETPATREESDQDFLGGFIWEARSFGGILGSVQSEKSTLGLRHPFPAMLRQLKGRGTVGFHSTQDGTIKFFDDSSMLLRYPNLSEMFLFLSLTNCCKNNHDFVRAKHMPSGAKALAGLSTVH